MRNGRTEKYFDLDSVKNKNNKISRNKKPSQITFRYFVSFLNNQDFHHSNIAKFFKSFINPLSCYVVVKKSQQVFHVTFVISVIINNLILIGAHKNYKSMHRVTITAR